MQVGIASFVSDEGCDVKMPAVYTRVALFLEYIEEVTGISIKDD